MVITCTVRSHASDSHHGRACSHAGLINHLHGKSAACAVACGGTAASVIVQANRRAAARINRRCGGSRPRPAGQRSQPHSAARRACCVSTGAASRAAASDVLRGSAGRCLRSKASGRSRRSANCMAGAAGRVQRAGGVGGHDGHPGHPDRLACQGAPNFMSSVCSQHSNHPGV